MNYHELPHCCKENPNERETLLFSVMRICWEANDPIQRPNIQNLNCRHRSTHGHTWADGKPRKSDSG
jgi:hypothetical protein